MIKLRFTLLILLSIPAFLSGQYVLEANEISFVFASKNVSGSISDFRSASVIDQEDFTRSVLEGTVGVATLKTGNFLRDWALKSRKYFDEDEYPRIHFKSNSITELAEGYEVTGVLTLRGTSNPFKILFKMVNGQLTGTAYLNTSDYGINIKKEREENRVQVAFSFALEPSN